MKWTTTDTVVVTLIVLVGLMLVGMTVMTIMSGDNAWMCGIPHVRLCEG